MDIVKRTVWVIGDERSMASAARMLEPPLGILTLCDPQHGDLYSPYFAQMPVNELLERVDQMLADFITVLHAYEPGLERVLNATSTSDYSDSGERVGGASRPFSIRIGPPAARDLGEAHATGSTVAVRLLELAQSDADVRQALRLLRDPRISWASLYDVMEFLRDRIPSEAQKLRDKYQRWANLERHRGGRLKPPPGSPPLREAQNEITAALRQWLDSKI